jgi:hypothetical protein
MTRNDKYPSEIPLAHAYAQFLIAAKGLQQFSKCTCPLQVFIAQPTPRCFQRLSPVTQHFLQDAYKSQYLFEKIEEPEF